MATLELLRCKTKPFAPKRLLLKCGKDQVRLATSALGCETTKDGFTYPCDEIVVLTLKHLFGDDLQISEDCEKWFQEHQARAKMLTEMAVAENCADIEISVPYASQLKAYQRACIPWAVNAKRGIIADDRGLGKTLEAITIALECNAKKVLIVAPGYLKYGWEREIEKWTTCTKIMLIGDRSERERLFRASLLKDTMFTIVNYEMVRLEKSRGGYPELHDQQWDLVFFDEGHRLCNRDNQWTIGAKQLKTKSVFVLTGNPVANNPDDLWSILNLLEPSRFTSYWKFVEYYCNVVDGFFGKDIQGVNHAHLAQLQFTLQPMLIRRLKEEVAPQLPQKIHHFIEVALEGKQKTFYRQVEKKMVIELVNGDIDVIDSVVAKNIRMQQALANPAILGGIDESVIESTALELIQDLFATSEKKVIVGMRFRGALSLFIEKLGKAKIKYYVVHGEVRVEDRDGVVEAFKNDKEPCVLVGTIAAMSEGINADECDNMIFMDKSYRPLDNDQFMDRIHRITSTRPKNYYHIVVRNTISEDREKVLKRKSEMQEEIMSFEAINQLVAKQVIERTQK